MPRERYIPLYKLYKCHICYIYTCKKFDTNWYCHFFQILLAFRWFHLAQLLLLTLFVSSMAVGGQVAGVTLRRKDSSSWSTWWSVQPYYLLVGYRLKLLGMSIKALTEAVKFSTCISIHHEGDRLPYLSSPRIFNFAGIVTIKPQTFFLHQKRYLHRVVRRYWQQQQSISKRQIGKKAVTLAGDARCDSMGHSAKYLSYSLMDTATNKLLSVQLIQVGWI